MAVYSQCHSVLCWGVFLEVKAAMKSVFVESLSLSWRFHFIRFAKFFQTDDKGVFATSLSEEYALAAVGFGLSRKDLWNISFQAVSHVFEEEATKEELRKFWMEWQCTRLILNHVRPSYHSYYKSTFWFLPEIQRQTQFFVSRGLWKPEKKISGVSACRAILEIDLLTKSIFYLTTWDVVTQCICEGCQ